MDQFWEKKQVWIKSQPDLLHVFCPMQSQTWLFRSRQQQMEWNMESDCDWTQEEEEIIALVFVPQGEFMEGLRRVYKWAPEQMAAGQRVCPQMALTFSTWPGFRFNIWSTVLITMQYLRRATGKRASTRMEAVAMFTRFWLNTWYKRQVPTMIKINLFVLAGCSSCICMFHLLWVTPRSAGQTGQRWWRRRRGWPWCCLLYTSDAADE